MPAFFINGYGNGLFKFGYALGVNGCNCPLIQNEDQFQFVNNWTKIAGNHTFKFGADIRRARNLRVPSDRHRSGELNFDAARTQGPNGGGTGLASFLIGDVSRFERYVSNSLDARETQNRWFFFAQDQWKSHLQADRQLRDPLGDLPPAGRQRARQRRICGHHHRRGDGGGQQRRRTRPERQCAV